MNALRQYEISTSDMTKTTTVRTRGDELVAKILASIALQTPHESLVLQAHAAETSPQSRTTQSATVAPCEPQKPSRTRPASGVMPAVKPQPQAPPALIHDALLSACGGRFVLRCYPVSRSRVPLVGGGYLPGCEPTSEDDPILLVGWRGEHKHAVVKYHAFTRAAKRDEAVRLALITAVRLLHAAVASAA